MKGENKEKGTDQNCLAARGISPGLIIYYISIRIDQL